MARALSSLAAFTAMTIVLFLYLGSYTRREQVVGELVPSGGLLAVGATGNGVVTRTLVEEGQQVDEGQALLEISTDINGAEVGAVGAAIGDELQRQRQRLQLDLSDQQISSKQRSAGANERIAMLRKQLLAVTAQCGIREQQLSSARKLLERLRPLAEKGLVSAFEISQHEAQALEADAQVHSMTVQRLDAERQLNTAQEQLEQQPTSDIERRHEMEGRLADIDQALARNDAQRSLVVRAPRAGIVSGLAISVGQNAALGQRLLALIPADSVLQAELWLPSRAIGFIAAGDRVVLRYRAYPYEKYGQQFGHVRDVARSALAPAEATRLLGQPIEAPVYRVTVELEHQALTIAGKVLPLRPNMALDADILLERRRLIEWLFEPLRALGWQSPDGAHSLAGELA
jgi:membrane fusion protein